MSYRDVSKVLRTLAQVLEDEPQESLPLSFEQRRLTAIQKLLAGEEADAGLLNYNLEAFHAGIAVDGPDPTAPLCDLRGRLSSRLLLVAVGEEQAWAWLGGNPRLVRVDLTSISTMEWPAETSVACGEVAEGIGGWRLSHRQALTALPVAQQRPTSLVHYPDVALLATALKDDLLFSALRHTYLSPLEEERDGGLVAKDTLRAYFRTSGNASSAGCLLGVNRTTVSNRLAAIERRLGRSIQAVSAELEVALRLDEAVNRDNTQQEVAPC